MIYRVFYNLYLDTQGQIERTPLGILEVVLRYDWLAPELDLQ